jgi:hypothetical protein
MKPKTVTLVTLKLTGHNTIMWASHANLFPLSFWHGKSNNKLGYLKYIHSLTPDPKNQQRTTENYKTTNTQY